MKKVWLKIFLIMAAASVFPFNGNAASRYYWQKQCQKMASENPVKIIILYNLGELKYNQELTSAQIKEKSDKSKLREGEKIMGLTVVNQYNRVNVEETNAIELADGYYCFYPTKITISTGYTEPIIYLAKEMKQGSCLYKKTLRHEQQHADLSYMFLKAYIDALKIKIPEFVSEKGYSLSTEQRPDKSFFEIYNEKINYIYDSYFQKRQNYTALMDSPKNYDRESRLCK